MSRLTDHLAVTDRRSRELTRQIDVYRNRVARKSILLWPNRQASCFLPWGARLGELARYRTRLLHAGEIETSLSSQDDALAAHTVNQIPPSNISEMMRIRLT